MTKRKNLDPSSRREPAKFRSTASSRPRIPIAFGFAARFSPRASFTNQNREFSNSLIQSKKKSSPLCDGGWRMLGGRSLLKRRASIHRAQRHTTRHFPTRKTTRIALKTTLSIKRARKIEPHILDLLLNLAPSLPRGAHILDVLCSKEKQKQKRKTKKKNNDAHHFFLTVRGELHRRSLRSRHRRRSRREPRSRLWFLLLLLRFQVALERLFVKGFRECHFLFVCVSD